MYWQIPKRVFQGVVQASFAQERMWLLDQLAGSRSAYNCPVVLRIHGSLDDVSLHKSINEVVRRHEALRTTFAMSGDDLTQVIVPDSAVLMPIEDLAAWPAANREEYAKRLVEIESRRPFDLSRGPVFRTLLLRLSAEDHFLVATFHHIVLDGWSSSVFIRELACLYDAFAGDGAYPPEPIIQYADYAVWQRENIGGQELERQLSFWRSHLAGAPPMIDLPTDYRRPRLATLTSGQQSIVLEPGLVRELKNLSISERMTLFVTMLAAFQILMEKWTGQKDFVVGTVVANRNRSEVENLIGCFVNFLPLRCSMSEDQAGLRILEETKRVVTEAHAHQDCPFQKMVRETHAPRTTNHNPFYNVVFLLQNFPKVIFSPRALSGELVPLATEIAHVDLHFAATESGDGTRVYCEYRTDLFDAVTIENLLRSYREILGQFVRDPNVPLSAFRLSQGLQTRVDQLRKVAEPEMLAVTATFTAGPLEDSLRFWMDKFDMQFRLEFGRYGQVFQDLLDPTSALSRNKRGLNIVLVRLEDLCSIARGSISGGDHVYIQRQLERNVEDLLVVTKAAVQASSVPMLMCLCPLSLRTRADGRLSGLFAQLHNRIATHLDGEQGVQVVTPADLEALYPVADYEDAYAHEVGHIPYTQKLFDALGTMIVRQFYRILSPQYKVIVLDCDGTLWRGICSEDGPEGVEIGSGFRALQEFMIARRDGGMLLCLCSKNQEEDVWSVFDENRGMILNRRDITASRINWKAKTDNLRSLADELRLGLESFIFLDDSPAECAEVEALCPEVLTVQIPTDESQLMKFLSHVWAFDRSNMTEEDHQRNRFYSQNAQREISRKEYVSLDDFLRGLELAVDISPLGQTDLARVSQLTQRTNQFNSTGIRRSEPELATLLKTPNRECLVVRMRDRFGDYGLVGAMIFDAFPEMLDVDTLVLSCRALGKRVEHQMLVHLGQIAQKRKLAQVRIKCAPTQKNQPLIEFLRSIGGELDASIANVQTCDFLPQELIGFETYVCRAHGPR